MASGKETSSSSPVIRWSLQVVLVLIFNQIHRNFGSPVFTYNPSGKYVESRWFHKQKKKTKKNCFQKTKITVNPKQKANKNVLNQFNIWVQNKKKKKRNICVHVWIGKSGRNDFESFENGSQHVCYCVILMVCSISNHRPSCRTSFISLLCRFDFSFSVPFIMRWNCLHMKMRWNVSLFNSAAK